MEKDTDICRLCTNKAQITNDYTNLDYVVFQCPNCGNYYWPREFPIKSTLDFQDKRHLLSGYVREMQDNYKSKVFLTRENYSDIINSAIIPNTASKKLAKWLMYLYQKTTFFGERVLVEVQNNVAVFYAKNIYEASAIVKASREKGFITSTGEEYTLTYAGIQEAESLIQRKADSNKCFVAMWFNSEMDTVYSDGIKQAIEDEQCGGFKAFRIDNREFNDDITDAIIAEIKECRFVVADLSGYRGGVYYEAGYAKGMGKPVIFTCRRDWFEGETDGQGNRIKERVHFDINHMNIIVWETPEELKKKLINRIRSTIL